jgi:predicted RND superfamily exporter protein
MKNIFINFICKKPKLIILSFIILTIISATGQKYFYLDASSDSLALENDQDVKFYQEITKKYGSDNFLIITFTPKTKIFSKLNLKKLEALQNDLKKITYISKVTSILNLPLFNSPKIEISDIGKKNITLLHPNVDLLTAPQELINNPLYNNNLISADGNTTALLLELPLDKELLKYTTRKNELIKKQVKNNDENIELTNINKKIKEINHSTRIKQDITIKEVREILEKYKNDNKIYLGGLPMIISDSIAYISNDIKIFGISIILVICLISFIIFRNIRFILLPLLCAGIVIIILSGYLGYANWPITTVSANFIALLLILTISITMHLIVKYQEEIHINKKHNQLQLISSTCHKMAIPCLYTTLTSMVAFASLTISSLKPVIDFGWMMFIGLIIAYISCFTFFPAINILLKKIPTHKEKNSYTSYFTKFTAEISIKKPILTILLFTFSTGIGIYGISKISVENRFIDYYKKDTEIYQGMYEIDNKLGGTIPLDIIINPPKTYKAPAKTLNIFGQISNNKNITSGYWLNSLNQNKIKELHQYFANMPEIGKVTSIYTTLKMLEQIDHSFTENNFNLELIYKKLPDDIKKQIFSPFISDDGNQIRINNRIYETNKELKRNEFINKIKNDLEKKFNLEKDQFRLTGMTILYNNILQSLFKSQILTIGFVFFIIFLMFIILFKKLNLAIIAIIPNIFSAIFILGLMGLSNISLDIMTITITAISIGIAVDNTIHYIHRFKQEIKNDNNHQKAIRKTHDSIGKAIYYTATIISAGFLTLTLSNFMPTIYFGALTASAMLLSLFTNLLLLPALINIIKPRA